MWASVQQRISIHKFEERVEHGHSGGVIPGPISNPEVKPSCVVSCTVVRKPTGTFIVVPLYFIPRKHYNQSASAIFNEDDIIWEFQLVVYSVIPRSEYT